MASKVKAFWGKKLEKCNPMIEQNPWPSHGLEVDDNIYAKQD